MNVCKCLDSIYDRHYLDEQTGEHTALSEADGEYYLLFSRRDSHSVILVKGDVYEHSVVAGVIKGHHEKEKQGKQTTPL